MLQVWRFRNVFCISDYFSCLVVIWKSADKLCSGLVFDKLQRLSLDCCAPSLPLSLFLSEFPRQCLCEEFHWDADRHQCRQYEGDAHQLLWVSIWRSYFCKLKIPGLPFIYFSHILPVKYPRYQKWDCVSSLQEALCSFQQISYHLWCLSLMWLCMSVILTTRSDFDIQVFNWITLYCQTTLSS